MRAPAGHWIAALLLAACRPPAPEGAPPKPASVVTVPEPVAAPAAADPPVARRSGSTVTASGLGVEDLRLGSAPTAGPGMRVRLHYVGALEDGTVFDSSRDRGTPFEVLLGRGHLIKGFEEGVTGMGVGGVRRLTIPPDLGYGARAHAKIPEAFEFGDAGAAGGAAGSGGAGAGGAAGVGGSAGTGGAGDCGSCPSGMLCESQRCQCTAAPQCGSGNDVECNGDGRCVCDGDPCRPGEVCRSQGGNLRCSCNGGDDCGKNEHCCSSGCANPWNDEANCGGCGRACAQGQHCVAGKCID